MWKKVKEDLVALPYFGVSDVAQHLDIENEEAGQILARWTVRGVVIRIKRGIYMSREYYLRHLRDYDFSGLVATIINPDSYLSKEYVLQKHQVMTEAVMVVTSVTFKNTSRVNGTLGSYIYYHVKQELFGGYTEILHGQLNIKEATLGKALFDYLYLRPQGWSYGQKDYNLREDLRLNLEELKSEDWREFESWVEKSNSKKMRAAQDNIRRHI